MKTGLILLAGGSSQRFQGHLANIKQSFTTRSDSETATVSKLLMLISEDKTVLEHSFEQFTQALPYDALCIVSHPQWQKPYEEILKTHPHFDASKTQWVTGGETRRSSVFNGLSALKDQAIDLVLIHDAARPLVTQHAIQQLFQTLQNKTVLGASLGRPSQNSLKRVIRGSNQVIESMPREDIWQVHTPQGFQFNALWQAHQSTAKDSNITDDMMLLDLAQLSPTLMVLDEASNIKLTSTEDLRLIQALCK